MLKVVAAQGGRSTLRSFTGLVGKGAVRAIKWLGDGKRIVVGGDDGKVRVLNVMEGTVVRTVGSHGDAVRCIVKGVMKDEALVATGGYDGMVKVWNIDTGELVTELECGEGVEGLVLLRGRTVLVTASGSEMKVWDMAARRGVEEGAEAGGDDDEDGGDDDEDDFEEKEDDDEDDEENDEKGKNEKESVEASSTRPLGSLIHTAHNHTKAITTLLTTSAHNGLERILTCGIDGHVKFYDADTFEVVHALKYPSPITDVAVGGKGTRFVVGMSNGNISVKTRTAEAAEKSGRGKKRQARGGTYAYFVRGKNEVADIEDFTVEVDKKKKVRTRHRTEGSPRRN